MPSDSRRVQGAVERARRLAENVLFPAAGEVDACGVIPPSHFTALADAGLYGVALEAPADLPAVTEILAGACLATTFTWMQHHGAVRTLSTTARADLRERWLSPAAAGALRCGVAMAGAIPDPPRLWATRTAGGWRLDGEAPLVTGWGLVNLVQVAARDAATAGAADDQGTIVLALLDAEPVRGLVADPLALVAANASHTVRLVFDGVEVPDDRVAAIITRAAFLAGMAASSRINGSLALGVAGRCVRLIAERDAALAERLDAEVDAARSALDAAALYAAVPTALDATLDAAVPADLDAAVSAGLDAGLADPSALPVARAAASELAYRAAGALVVVAGSAAILGVHPAGRLLREAAFTLVAAGRPEIRSALLTGFAR